MAKGQEINSRTIERLKQYDISNYSHSIDKPCDPSSKYIPGTFLFYETSAFKQYPMPPCKHQKIDTTAIETAFQTCNKKIFENSAAVVGDVIFDSENESWKLIINTLCCRYGWVYTHSINVALLSLIIAENIGMDKKQLKNLAIGALFHDVGKILIPKDIIDKKSSLTPKEMVLVMQHCELGISLVEAYNLPKESLDVILQHHERLNGSGYPYGLTSDEIHPFAKIAMIADVLDAITSARPYRPAKSIGDAISILKQDENTFSREYITVIEKLLKIMG